MFRWGRGLRTSFNSTLLWKLQLPLSRLAPWPHPSASALFATQTTPTGHLPWKNPGELKDGLHVGGTTQTQRRMFDYVCTCASDLQSLYMHEKGTLKHLVKTENQ